MKDPARFIFHHYLTDLQKRFWLGPLQKLVFFIDIWPIKPHTMLGMLSQACFDKDSLSGTEESIAKPVLWAGRRFWILSINGSC